MRLRAAGIVAAPRRREAAMMMRLCRDGRKARNVMEFVVGSLDQEALVRIR
jgi:hypothetical protein